MADDEAAWQSTLGVDVMAVAREMRARALMGETVAESSFISRRLLPGYGLPASYCASKAAPVSHKVTSLFRRRSNNGTRLNRLPGAPGRR
jgi:hypothetical protein